MTKHFYIETLGCQMNVLDSELAAAGLLELGYRPTEDRRKADLIIFNTCSVRQHAEDKVYSALGRLKHLKTQKPGKMIAVLGCMAQKDRELVFRRAPHVDIVLGPGQLAQLPDIVRRIEAGEGPICEVSMDRKQGARREIAASFQPFDPMRRSEVRRQRHQAMLRIMFGCDKFCTYCIVPSVRGPEQSRPPAEIVAEARQLAEQGVVEITLVGQTVNSYRYKDSDRTHRLSDLLYAIHDIDGLQRLRFVTNYPLHMTQDLLEAVRDLPKVCPYLHVPAQSGSNRILDRMKRRYTVEEYRDMLARIRETVPEAAVTSDFIVGFCGETDDDFEATVTLVREARFKNSFIFKYSPREGTKAFDLYPDDVPEAVKRARNNHLLAVQNEISLEENRRFVGRTVEILVEGASKASRKSGDPQEGQLSGRTMCDRIVVFDGDPSLIGRIVPVTITDATAVTLFGTTASAHAETSYDTGSAARR
ncbi:tRNA (N6-isopentenyl adenosine(37)-C2)-methylthiotransferase MiaB [Thermostilla marina]